MLKLLHAMQVYWSLQSFEFYNINGASETKRFADMFDRFFDCLNVKNLGEYKKKKKPNLSPYYDPNEECLTWLEKEFLGYLKEWKESVDNRSGFTEAEKALMCLSKETLKGLHMTVKSFVEVTLHLLTLQGVSGQYILSSCFCQDPLENYFGNLRLLGD
eukprot:Em0016g223a